MLLKIDFIEEPTIKGRFKMTNTNTNEIWKAIPGYEGIYEVSNLGNVRSLDRSVEFIRIGKEASMNKRGKDIIKPYDNKEGYMSISLTNHEGKRRTEKVHRLIAIAFINNPDPATKTQVNHIDGNSMNNSIENLEWVSPSENSRDAGKRRRGVPRQRGNLNLEKARYIREVHVPRHPEFGTSALAREFGVSNRAITKILANETWREKVENEEQA